MPELNSQEQFNNIVNKYLENVTKRDDGTPEFEIRFGTKGIKTISKIDFDNVIQKLKSSGFSLLANDDYSLKIQSEFLDKKTGQTKPSSIRVEINGLHNVQKYCETNSLKNVTPSFTQKRYANISNGPVYPVDINDYNLRASFQTEKKIPSYGNLAENIIANWENSKKTFRYINRISFVHDKYPIRADLSIVKENNYEQIEYKGRKIYRPKPEYNFQSAGVVDNIEKYEIELEILNNKVGAGTDFTSVDILTKTLRRVIIYILSGLQMTNYPIPYSEIQDVGKQYLKLVHGDNYNERMKMKPKLFLGPSSMTLQMKHIMPTNEDSGVPNIRNDYTVTEKADGLRKLLYINKEGKMYLIDTNMNVQFTGAVTKNVDTFNTILDGEHILHNKNGEYINLYAAFDIYIMNGKDIRTYSFIPSQNNNEPIADYRLPLLINIVKNLDAKSSVNDRPSPIRIENKKFKAENDNVNIFQCCNTIIDQQKQGLYEYEVDGLIFTPAYLGVASDTPGKAGSLMKPSWEHSFKWKPSEFNTVDFLVTTKKDTNGTNDAIGNIFQDGINTTSNKQLSQYKTIILRVGFDEKKHGYINPCADVINNNLPKYGDDIDQNTYKPLPFYPTNPTDMETNICNIMLRDDETGNKRLFTEENEVFDDGMIVEFRYDLTRENRWRWVPLRVRYDKTEEYKKGFPQYGNAYHVANNNWHSIHNPISEKMIRTGEDIPDDISDSDVYYNRGTGPSKTKSLRDFHNMFVKKMLITSVSTRGNTLIDYAVGKGGDFPKWIGAKLSFVFGIDVSKDNIENRIDGACARFLNYKKDYKVIPNALFVHGNSEFNIKTGESLYSEKGKQITNAVFGEGPKDKDQLGLGVYSQYGKASEGFNISSCQFALHYFFKDKRTLNNFIRNVSECTKVNGYFVGGCYNGSLIFDALQGKEIGESVSIFEDNKKIWQVTKGYSNSHFDNDETSIGYAIDVYQETINKTFREYLVNFDYLNRIMENYGFTQLTRDECSEIGIPNSVGSFQQLYGLMDQEISKNPKKKRDYGSSLNMTPNEKKISFYNNYFIYKKTRNVDTISVFNTLIGSSKLQEHLNKLEEDEVTESIEKDVTKQNKKVKAPKKLSKKLKLKQNSIDSTDSK